MESRTNVCMCLHHGVVLMLSISYCLHGRHFDLCDVSTVCVLCAATHFVANVNTVVISVNRKCHCSDIILVRSSVIFFVT